MKKSEFKSIVKECLMEILSEGIGNLNIPNINENKVSKSNSPISSSKQQKQHSNSKNNNENSVKNKLIEEERKKQLLLKQKKELMLKLNKNNLHDSNSLINKQQKQLQSNKITSSQPNQALNKLREDHKNVMMSIFEDTAKNMGNSNLDEPKYHIPDGASKEQIAVSNSSPEELFGVEVANKWASLAFLEDENKK